MPWVNEREIILYGFKVVIITRPESYSGIETLSSI